MARSIRIAEPPPRFVLKVQSVELVADEVYRIRLDRHPLPWTPGDCVTVFAPGEDMGRPYSFSGPPQADYVEFWVRHIPSGRVSSWFTQRVTGHEVEVSLPFGWFRPLEPLGVPKVFVATGTGVAPFLSAFSSSTQEKIPLLWGMRHMLPLPDVLQAHPVHRYISRESQPGTFGGRVTEGIRELELNEDTHVYLCGLGEMIEEVRSLLEGKGCAPERIHTECFFTSSSSSS